MKNLGGLVIAASGVLLFVVGWRGTQHAVFPGLFAQSAGTPTTAATTQTTAAQPAPVPSPSSQFYTV